MRAEKLETIASKEDLLRAEIHRILQTKRTLSQDKVTKEWIVTCEVGESTIESSVSAECLTGLLTFAENCKKFSEDMTFDKFMTIVSKDEVLTPYIQELLKDSASYMIVEHAIRVIFDEVPDSDIDHEVEEELPEGQPEPRHIRRFVGLGVGSLILMGALMVTSPDDRPTLSSAPVSTVPRPIPTVPTTTVQTTVPATILPIETVPVTTIAVVAETVPPTTIVVPETVPATLPPEAVAVTEPVVAPVETPAPVETIYIVQKGDSLNIIAERLLIDPAVLISWNPQILDPTKIYSGQPIIIHESAAGSIPVPVVTAPVSLEQAVANDGAIGRKECIEIKRGTPYAFKTGENVFDVLGDMYGDDGREAALDEGLLEDFRLRHVLGNNPASTNLDYECLPPEELVRR